jgi:hypothetical protein
MICVSLEDILEFCGNVLHTLLQYCIVLSAIVYKTQNDRICRAMKRSMSNVTHRVF